MMRSKLKLTALAVLAVAGLGVLGARLFLPPAQQPQGLVGVQVGVQVGPLTGPAVGISSPALSNPLVLMLGDSQISGRSTANPPTDGSNPGFNPLATQAQTFVYFDKLIAESLTDPTIYDTELTGGVRGYPVSGPDTFMGTEISIGEELTRQGLTSVLASQSVVGLPVKDMVPSPSPAYPTTGASWLDRLALFAHGIEAAKGAQVQVAIVSADNNDGFNTTDSNNVTTNNSLFAAGLVSRFPGLRAIVWLKINADTVNFPGFIANTITLQTTWFTNNPTVSGVAVKPLWFDDQLLQSDHAHLIGNGYLTVGQRAAWLALDALGRARPRPTTTPAILGYGPATADNIASVPSGWGGAQAGDLELLFSTQMVASGTEGTLTTPSGWTLKGSATSANSTPGFQVRTAVFARAVDATMLLNNHGNTAATSVTLDTPNTVNYNEIITIRGPNTLTTSNVDLLQFSTTSTATTSFTLTGGTTTAANEVVIEYVSGFTGGALTACPVTITGGNLNGLAVTKNGVHSTPNAAVSVVDVESGTLAAAGATGNMTATLALSTTQPVGVVVSVKP